MMVNNHNGHHSQPQRQNLIKPKSGEVRHVAPLVVVVVVVDPPPLLDTHAVYPKVSASEIVQNKNSKIRIKN